MSTNIVLLSFNEDSSTAWFSCKYKGIEMRFFAYCANLFGVIVVDRFYSGFRSAVTEDWWSPAATTLLTDLKADCNDLLRQYFTSLHETS